jgi:hypothetical protein
MFESYSRDKHLISDASKTFALTSTNLSAKIDSIIHFNVNVEGTLVNERCGGGKVLRAHFLHSSFSLVSSC